MPDDAIRERVATAILLGRSVGETEIRYGRMRQRLYAAVDRGTVTRYLLMGRARYSRREVEALREQLASDGIGPRALTQGKHRDAMRKRMESLGLVDTDTAAKLTGAEQRTAAGWAQRGLYGARKLHGQWWLELEELPTSRRPYEPPQTVRCAQCGELHDRPAGSYKSSKVTGTTYVEMTGDWKARS